jgi:leukotriene-A4 hydrolase
VTAGATRRARAQVACAEAVAECLLDTRDLSITAVTGADGAPLAWAMAEGTEALGAPLQVTLAGALSEGQSVAFTVAYSTSPSSMAVQWLPKEQTAGGQSPYMFTQCQAIHARALLPCQDSPGVKAPYTAALTVPNGLVGLMSALSTSFPAASEAVGGKRTFTFSQPVPMSTYLIAIAAGNLEKRKVHSPQQHPHPQLHFTAPETAASHHITRAPLRRSGRGWISGPSRRWWTPGRARLHC